MNMRDVVIQLHVSEYHDFVRYLVAMGFRRVVLDTPQRRFKTLGQLLRQYTSGLLQLLIRLRSVRGVGTVIVFSHFAFAVKLLARFGLTRYKRLFCFGFFLHDPRWFPIFRWLVRLDRANDHYIIFSESEADLYQAELGIAAERMHFVPLGDWRQMRSHMQFQPATGGEYYFAGGRSNRDYRPLVEAFRSIPAKLVIVCSRTNLEELQETDLPPNVDVKCDVSISAFDDYIRRAKAGIILMRHDTGSAGQSVALALMRNAKCLLATRVGGLQGYIDHGVSGYWMDDVAEDLSAYIRRLEEDPGLAETMGRAARQRYEQRFSLSIATSAFENVLASVCSGAGRPEDEIASPLAGNRAR
jgi:glycosyltransferase involved in cell wall biosynthesis